MSEETKEKQVRGEMSPEEENGEAGSEGGIPENGEAEQTEDAAAGKNKANKRKKRAALILILVLVLIAAVVIPLSQLDYWDVRGLFTGKKQEKILYCTAVDEDIWKNETYMSETSRTLKLAAGPDQNIDARFDSEEEALSAFAQMRDISYGGEAFAAYFSYLIKGLQKSEAADFAALFAEAFQDPIPKRFFSQKISSIDISLSAHDEDKGTSEWIVTFSVMNNDGMAVNYFASRDGGRARFSLIEERGGWKIAKISTIYPQGGAAS